MNNKKTLKESGMRYIQYQGNKEHILYDTCTQSYEVWFSNKDHASFGLIYKNTHLEFARSIKKEEMINVTYVKDLTGPIGWSI